MNMKFMLCALLCFSTVAVASQDHGFFVKTEIGLQSESSFLKNALQNPDVISVENFATIPGLHFVHIQPQVEIDHAMKTGFMNLSGVEYMEKVHRRAITARGFKALPNAGNLAAVPQPIEKPAPPAQWQDDPKRYSNYALGMSRTWPVWKTKTIGSPDVIIADIDTGVDYNHKDLAGNIWRNNGEMGLDSSGADKRNNGVDDDGNGYVDDYIGYNFGDNNNLPYDDHGHGSHTSGTAAAVGGNGYGISGVCPRCSIMPLRFITASGSGSDVDAIRAIDYAVRMGAKILSCSWGGKETSQPLYDAFKAADERGVMSVIAAGNNGEDLNNHMFFPARYNLPNQLTVAALYPVNIYIPFWSNYGNAYVHISQAGDQILSTVPGDKFDAYSGTSMATPGIAGAVGLIWSYRPDLTAAQIKKLLSKNILGDRDSMGKVKFHGRPDLQKLFEKLN
jgi:subtilisin family serine protease